MGRDNFNPQVGDFVRIRQWDDMNEKFGTDCGKIDCVYTFTEEMKEFCGGVFKIIRITTEVYIGKEKRYFLEKVSDSDDYHRNINDYYISKDMLEPTVEIGDEEDIDPGTIGAFLSQLSRSC